MSETKIKELEDKIISLEKRLHIIEKFIEPQVESHKSQEKLFNQAVKLVSKYEKVSASLLQRTFAIGYASAARLLDILEKKGYIDSAKGSEPRKVLKKE